MILLYELCVVLLNAGLKVLQVIYGMRDEVVLSVFPWVLYAVWCYKG